MKLHSRKIVRVFGATILMLLLAAAPVWAAEPVNVEVVAPQEVTLGETVTVQVAVRDSEGSPVSGVTVTLLSPAALGSTSAEMRLGQVTTDEAGSASFSYQARREGQQTLIARFSGNQSYSPAETSAELGVLGSAQLYQQKAGVTIPGVGVWILVLLLGAFWSVYLVVMVLVTLIAREGGKAPMASGGSHG